jgi:hypothetical protein
MMLWMLLLMETVTELPALEGGSSGGNGVGVVMKSSLLA